MKLWDKVCGEKKFTLKHFIGLGLFMVVFILSTAGAVAYTSQSDFCGSCHEMSPMYKTWAASGHKDIACAECHEEPGALGVVKSKAKGTKELYLHMTGDFSAPKADARDVNCYGCHQDKVKNVETAAERKDPHTKKHFDNGMNCLSCHSGLVHDEMKNKTLPSRATCVSCHWDEMNK
ncbi:cytochrome c3 family protein [Anaerosinus massiliensis]|uniref:cytochrome c3 family protein n=1 Tax=Massilibacillus massiliensis TaxID=1806837 RepID=UPI000DA5F881|nr:NapC/NirT family cytochrome c [Massilibacillus massiliensis]